MHAPAVWQRPVSYGAVGATQAPDLMQHAPKGFRAIETRTRIGFGDNRWEYAWTQALTWGIQRASGMTVTLSESPAAVTDLTYTPVGFDEEGNPVEPATIGSNGDALFGPDGREFLKPGDTVTLTVPVGPFKSVAPVRVVYVIDEPTRKGFAYGTLTGHPISGEEMWVIERTEDGSVWMNIRAFSRPAHWYLWFGYPALRIMQSLSTRRYQRALSGPIPD